MPSVCHKTYACGHMTSVRLPSMGGLSIGGQEFPDFPPEIHSTPAFSCAGCGSICQTCNGSFLDPDARYTADGGSNRLHSDVWFLSEPPTRISHGPNTGIIDDQGHTTTIQPAAVSISTALDGLSIANQANDGNEITPLESICGSIEDGINLLHITHPASNSISAPISLHLNGISHTNQANVEEADTLTAPSKSCKKCHGLNNCERCRECMDCCIYCQTCPTCGRHQICQLPHVCPKCWGTNCKLCMYCPECGTEGWDAIETEDAVGGLSDEQDRRGATPTRRASW